MVDIVPGYTYDNTDGAINEQVNAGNLHTLIEGAVLSNIQRGEFATTSKPFSLGASEPGSPSEADLWFDTTLNMIRRYKTDRWEPIGRGMALTNAMSSVAAKGMAVRISATNNSFTPTTTSGDGTCIGVLAATVAGSAIGVVVSEGLIEALFTGTQTIGLALQPSEVTGYLEPLTLPGATFGSDVGIIMTTQTSSGLHTAFLWK